MKTLPIITLSIVLASCQTPQKATPTTPHEPLASRPASSETTPALSSKKDTISPKETIKPYPIKTCLVTDEPLDEWDEMQRVVYKNQEMKFCCKMCLRKFNKDPERYLKLLPKP